MRAIHLSSKEVVHEATWILVNLSGSANAKDQTDQICKIELIDHLFSIIIKFENVDSYECIIENCLWTLLNLGIDNPDCMKKITEH